MIKPRVLFLCTGNSCRSQMAEGMARFLSRGEVDAFSAGTHPKEMNSSAVQAMVEAGVDISHQRSKGIEEFSGQEFDFVITVCDRAREECPVWPETQQRIHWSLDDPAEAMGTDAQRLAVLRRVRDEIRLRIQLFLIASGLQKPK